MELSFLVAVLVMGVAGWIGVRRILGGVRARGAAEVYEALADLDAADDDDGAAARLLPSVRLLNDDLGKIGLLMPEERVRFRAVNRALPGGCALLCFSLALMAGGWHPPRLVVAAGAGAALGYLLARSRIRSRARGYRRSLEYFLPLVMERIVMAVEAGLDIIAGVQHVVQLEHESEREARTEGFTYEIDPVCKLMEIVLQLAEAGLRFERSLQEVAEAVECAALKHAFVHLALAQKEGGELIMPLRELSDATQLHYQESVEEEIAALPVKATLPLVCTFAGLIVCFITTPLIQVMRITGQAMLH